MTTRKTKTARGPGNRSAVARSAARKRSASRTTSRPKTRTSATRKKPRPGRRAILVLGMHRSGTSALTRVLAMCGASLPEHLMPATDRNPRGYFESQRIFELHEELLAEAGSAWDDFSAFPRDWFDSPTAASWVGRMAQAVREEFGESPFFVVKDPRVCRLVPFWDAVLAEVGAEPSFVIAARNPLEVARSLKRSQGTDEARGLVLWLQHFLAAEHDTRGRPRTIVGYDELLRDWRGTVRKIGADLDLRFPRRTAAAAAQIDDFLSQRLRNQRVPEDELLVREDVAGWVKEVYQWVIAASAGRPVATRVLTKVRREFEVADAVYAPLVAKTQLDAARTAAEAAHLDNEVKSLREEVVARAGEIERLCTDLQTAQSQAALQEQQLEHLTSDLGSRERDLDQLGGELKSLREEILDREQEVARLGADLRTAESQVALSEQRLEHLTGSLGARERDIGQLIETVKLVLQWAASVLRGPNAVAAIEPLYDAIDSGNLAVIPQIASAGLQLAEKSAEAARFAEESTQRANEIERLARELQSAIAERDLRGEEIGRLTAELGERGAEVERKLALLHEKDARLAELETRVAGLTRVEEALATQNTARANAERALEERTAAHERELERLGVQLRGQEAAARRAREELRDARHSLRAEREESDRLRRLDARRAEEIERLTSEIEAGQQALEQSLEDRSLLEVQASERERERDELVALLGAAREEALARKTEAVGLGEQALVRDAEVGRLTAELAAQRTATDEVQHAVTKARRELADRDFLIRELQDRLRAIEGSVTWRVTRPARELAKSVRPPRR